MLRAREIRVRSKQLAVLSTDLCIQRFRAQSRTCVKPERREDPDRRSDVEMYGPLGRGLRKALESPTVCSELALPLALLNVDAYKPRAGITIRSRSATMRFPAARRRSASVGRRSAIQIWQF